MMSDDSINKSPDVNREMRDFELEQLHSGYVGKSVNGVKYKVAIHQSFASNFIRWPTIQLFRKSKTGWMW